MKNIIEIRNMRLGTGHPKICIPITASGTDEILNETGRIKQAGADLLEWRVDFYEAVEDLERVLHTLTSMREIAGELPIIFTYRTSAEGGNRPISRNDYERLLVTVAKCRQADLIDVELYSQGDHAKKLVDKIQTYDTKVIASNHNFQKTPKKEEIFNKLQFMQEQGADIGKIAVMPVNQQDVLELLSATSRAALELTIPVITMSMGQLGAISRVTGEVFGSCLTFGTIGASSAPGQIPIETLQQVLPLIHQISIK